ncbi:hypothetical protein E4P43_06615 [Blastococcus sp. TF02A-35]|nr:hypothetical protein E4P43_06615 [Blastococcus sp. TF02A_35]
MSRQLGGFGDAAHDTCAAFRPRENQGRPAHLQRERRAAMSKRGRKRRSRKGNKANHGKRPNA